VLRIGEYVLAGHRFPVCLVFTGEPDQLRCDVDGLAARAEPFVLLVPTRSAVTHVCADLFKRAKSSFLPLNELLGQGDDGRLSLLDGHTGDSVLADFRAIQVSQPKDDGGMVVFPTSAYEFKVVGEVWHVRFGNEYGEIVDRVGMARLADASPDFHDGQAVAPGNGPCRQRLRFDAEILGGLTAGQKPRPAENGSRHRSSSE